MNDIAAIQNDAVLGAHGQRERGAVITPGGAAAEELFASRLGPTGCDPRDAPVPRRPTCCAGPGSGRCGAADTAPKTVLRSTFATPCGRSGNLVLRSVVAWAASEDASGLDAIAGVAALSWVVQVSHEERAHGNALVTGAWHADDITSRLLQGCTSVAQNA